MLVLLAILSVLIALLYYYGTKSFDYWAKRGVKHDPPVAFFGNSRQQMLQQISMTDIYTEMYWKYPTERFVGFFICRRPALIIRDPELIKNVLTTEFNYFHARAAIPFNKHEPIMKNLFTSDGDLWKMLRQRMTTAFSSAKLKSMFPLIVEKAELLDGVLDKAASSGAEVNLQEIMARYTTDFIGAVGFGIESDSLNDEDSQFRKVGKRIFTFTKWDSIRNLFKFMFPEILQRQHIFHPMVEENIVQLMRGVLKQRNYKPSGRNDYIDQLIELKQKGKISVESLEHRNADGSPKIVEMELDETLMAGQLFVFFSAGFETTSSSSSYTLHQLACHPEAQRRCQREVDEVLARHGGKLCYDAVNEMKYLEMCFKYDGCYDGEQHPLSSKDIHAAIKNRLILEYHTDSCFGEIVVREGMRLFPPLGFLKRRCEKKYHIPGTDFSIDPDVDIIIPMSGLQRDPKYFEDPDEFIPERFENRKFHKFAYLPFGDGPRACIGERLGRMQSLAGLAAVLRGYSVRPGPRAAREPPRDPTTAFIQSVLGGIPLLIVKRE